VGGTSAALLLRAALRPPTGAVFVGSFYYVDDFYNYLSYVEQASRGELAFQNKLAPPDAPAALVNLEWLGVGWLSALLGGRPLLAYRLFGILAVLALVALVDVWLGRVGLPARARLPALLLVFTGGGLGGPLAALGLVEPAGALDVRAGLYPFQEVVSNPHFVVGTALLLLALLAFADGRAVLGVVAGTVLGLVRPYEVVLLVAVLAISTLATRSRAAWPRGLLPLVGLAPVVLWNAWLFLASPGFRVFSSARYAAVGPTPLELAIALLPGAALAVAAWWVPAPDELSARHRLLLALWAGLAVAVGVARPVSFSLQLMVGIGVPLLALSAVLLARMGRGVLEAAVVLLAGTSLYVVALTAGPGRWHVPAERFRVAERLRAICRPGDVVLAPPDVGLYAGGLSPCWPYVSHAAAPAYPERDREARRFYSPDAGPERGAIVDRACARVVVLPPTPGPDGGDWSLEESGFREVPDDSGRGGGPAVLVRDRLPPGCPPARTPREGDRTPH